MPRDRHSTAEVAGVAEARFDQRRRSNLRKARLMFTLLSPVCLSLILASCSCAAQRDTQRSTGAARVFDSAGVRIIEYAKLLPAPFRFSRAPFNPLGATLADLPPAVSVDERPFLVLTDASWPDGQQLEVGNPFLSAVELERGGFVVMDMHRLVFLTPQGTFQRSVGRRGRGPGEFLQAGRLCRLPGDTLLVTDFIDRRVTLWSPIGDHVSTRARTGPRVSAECDARGRSIVQRANTGSTTDASVSRATYELQDKHGKLIRSLGQHPRPGVGSYAPTPWFVSSQEELTVGVGDRFELQVFDAGGRLRRVTRLVEVQPPVTDREWEEEVKAAVPLNASPATAERIRASRRARRPARYPSHSEIRRDALGRLWVADYGTDQFWTVVDSGGFIIGRFSVPGAGLSRTGLAGFGRDYLVVRSFDSDGAPFLAFHRIAPR